MKCLQISQLVRNGVFLLDVHCFEGTVYFSDGGFVVFQVTSNTPLVRVTGCVKFGGTITVDTSHLPKNISNITLMTFNCSTGIFDNVEGDATDLHYVENSLVLKLKYDDDQQQVGGDSYFSTMFTVVWVILSLVIAAIIVLAVCFIVKARKLENVLTACCR